MQNDLVTKIPLILVNNCLVQSSEESLLIFDNPTHWCCITNSSFHFKVLNSNKKELLFLAIDKCCLDNTFIGKRCDCAVIVENESFFLVEIKDTIKRKNQKVKAVQQLENTILHFRTLSLFDNTPNKIAIISWNYSPVRPIARSSINSARLRFFMNYRFDLLEGNELNIT